MVNKLARNIKIEDAPSAEPINKTIPQDNFQSVVSMEQPQSGNIPAQPNDNTSCDKTTTVTEVL